MKSKVVLITGSSAGIGKACALLFASKGYKVVVNGASNNGKNVEDEINSKYPDSAYFIQADISEIDECKKLFNKVLEKFERIDVLINCAGIVPVGTLLDIDEDEFDKAFNINVKGTFFLSKLVVKHMLSYKCGNIVNIGSIAGLIGPKNRALYSSTKGAIISLTRAMASDLAQTGIRVNCVCPGMVYSPSLEKRINETENPELTRAQFANNIPIKRIGTVEEIANAVYFVASEENSFMTGSIISVDGGASL